MKINIAIDGPSAAGKSTIAKILATKLNYYYLDTGAMYRCVALKANRLGLKLDNEVEIMAMLENTVISFDYSQHIFLDDEDVSNSIREKDLSLKASTVSLLKDVREDMVNRQRLIAAQTPGIVMEGRDIGSVVLPTAQLKIFLVANPQKRAKRRYDELMRKGENCDLPEILQDINRRDAQDTTRINSPLIKCADAIELDTSDLSIDEVVKVLFDLAISKGA